MRQVKIFSADNGQSLEGKINEWLNEGNVPICIKYAVRNKFYAFIEYELSEKSSTKNNAAKKAKASDKEAIPQE